MLTFSKKSLLFWLGWRHKYAALLQGYLSPNSIWDTLVFGPARTQALGQVTSSLRAIVVAEGKGHFGIDSGQNLTFAGSTDQKSLLDARVALSVPVVNAFSHPLSASPIFASHPLDMQMLDTGDENHSDSKTAHTGAPSCNVQVRLLKLDEDAVAKGGDPEGEVRVHSPSLLPMLTYS